MPSFPDIVVRDALIADGSGDPLAGGDVAIGDGQILSAGPEQVTAGPATAELDARGHLVCAPGFIDVHTHDDFAVFLLPEMDFKVAQGVTTAVVGNCGLGAAPFDSVGRNPR